MIRESRSWIDITATDHPARRAMIEGKWLCFGPTREMHLYRDLLHSLVEDGTFLAAKIARKDPKTDPFPHKDCVICVFTTGEREDRARVEGKLKEIGLNPASWKSDQETRDDWTPRGKLALEAGVVQGKKHLEEQEAGADDRTASPALSPAPAGPRPGEASPPAPARPDRLATTKLVLEILVAVVGLIGGVIALVSGLKWW